MSKQLTNEVPLIPLTVAEYHKNLCKKQYAAYSRKYGYFIDGKNLTVKEAEELYPTSHVKIITNLHPHRSPQQKGNGIKR